MPYKEACLALVDEVDRSAAVIGAVNTIVNDDGFLRAYNTDYLAVAALLADVPTGGTVAVLGSGGMARAVVAALLDAGAEGIVVARNRTAGPELARQYGWQWRADAAGLAVDLLVNATPVGMAGGPAADDLPAPAATVDTAGTVFEVVAVPDETPLVRRARANGAQVITGGQVIALQALEQFVLYTGVRPTDEQVAQAAAYSRSP
jgi:shikimate dehydrogenase